MNHIILMGRLTRDPELRHTQSGIPVASFSLAVDRRMKSASGERQADFIDCVAWRHTAEFVSKYFSKGRMCAVHGSLQLRDWQDKNGNNRRSAEVVVDNVYFTGEKRDDVGGGYHSNSPPHPANDSMPPIDAGYSPDNPVGASDFAELDGDDGDLPF